MSDSSLIEIEDLDELNSALEQSASTPVLLFKHSVTCGISARADRQMNKRLLKLAVQVKEGQKVRPTTEAEMIRSL